MTENNIVQKSSKSKALFKNVINISKWILVIWLIWPIQNALSGRVDFTRVLLGILLFIIFAGKIFYDSILRNQLKHDESSGARGLVDILGIAVGLCLIVGAVILFLGLLAFYIVQGAMTVEPE